MGENSPIGVQRRHRPIDKKRMVAAALKLLLAGVCAGPMVCAQPTATPVVNLTAITKVDAPLVPSASMIAYATCDSAGNVYARQADKEMLTDPVKRRMAPVQKITPAGSLAGSFQVADAFPEATRSKNGIAVPRHEYISSHDIFVTANGRAFQVVWVMGEVFVVEFAQDGSVKAKTKLLTEPGSRMSPWHLAVFGSGEYLVTGAIGKDRLTPFTAVFAADGRMVKKIYEPEDEDARSKARPGDLVAPSRGGNGGVDFVMYGGVTVGSDGNAYLLHGTTSFALVYVISPAGDVVRKLRIESGDPDLVARNIKSYAGRLAVEFDDNYAGEYRNLIKVTDLQGKSIADYGMGKVEGQFLYLAGYSAAGFHFMPYETTDDKKMFVVNAKLP